MEYTNTGRSAQGLIMCVSCLLLLLLAKVAMKMRRTMEAAAEAGKLLNATWLQHARDNSCNY